MSFPTVQGQGGQTVLFREPQVCLGPSFGLASYQFFLSGTGTPANVYQNGALTTPFPIAGYVIADSYGRFPAIYLDPSVVYRVQFYDGTNTLRWTVDPYVSQLATVGTSSLSAYGMSIAPTGEVTIPAPNSGGTGISLTLIAGALGSSPLEISSTLPGNSALIVNSSATTGAQTATFNANNKPGTPPASSFAVTATAAPTGSYTGGNLTAAFTGTTASNYTVALSTGQNLYNVTFTNGVVAFSLAATTITGTPTTALNVQTPVTPAGWLPITCDGVQYYTPIWHGNNFTPYLSNPGALGEVIAASSVLFGGNGLTTPTNGTATPSNWYSPVSMNVGAGYYINITKTGGQLSGLAFSAAQGVWTNIGAGGLTISSNAAATLNGTYQLSTSVTGSPVVASGTISLSGNNGVQQPTYNGAANLVLGGDGTATLNGASASSWYAPTTASVGAGYWININQTGGTSGYSFSAANGVWANITAGGLTVGVSGVGSLSYFVTGTYTIASDSAGVNQLGTGSITLTGGTLVQSPSWSGTTPLNLAGNGAATLNGAAASSWYSPNAANVGSGYWINITRTGGTSGVNFTAAQGSWTNITNGGLTIDMAGYTGDVGTVSVNGTYQISNSSSGMPVLGSGTIALSVSGLTVTSTYTTAGTYPITIPTGTSSMTLEIEGGGGGGGGSNATIFGNGGSSGGRCVSTYAITSGNWGQTLSLVVGASIASTGVVGNSGQFGNLSRVTAGTFPGFTTMTANGGGGGAAYLGGAGAGGSATGGNVTNQSGNTNTSQQAGAAGLTGTYVNGQPGATGAYHPSGTGQPDTATTVGRGAVHFS